MAISFEDAKQAVRDGGHAVNPWRVGRVMGRAWHADFWSWNAAANATRNWSDRPAQPACPYPNAAGRRDWEHGFKMESTAPKPKP